MIAIGHRARERPLGGYDLLLERRGACDRGWARGRASLREHEEKDGGRVVRSERYYGELYRSFALAAEIDESKAEAEYSDGILKLTLPKKSNGGAKRLAIK